jgi:hypothetical protein
LLAINLHKRHKKASWCRLIFNLLPWVVILQWDVQFTLRVAPPYFGQNESKFWSIFKNLNSAFFHLSVSKWSYVFFPTRSLLFSNIFEIFWKIASYIQNTSHRNYLGGEYFYLINNITSISVEFREFSIPESVLSKCLLWEFNTKYLTIIAFVCISISFNLIAREKKSFFFFIIFIIIQDFYQYWAAKFILRLACKWALSLYLKILYFVCFAKTKIICFNKKQHMYGFLVKTLDLDSNLKIKSIKELDLLRE